ncbi:MAG: 5,6-dimethylbenzimidazole synthase [Rhodospirillaceae bacterium]|nr:5,6-dimethylbenzimidazole synthase [Rhodospirillaceae bacterium]
MADENKSRPASGPPVFDDDFRWALGDLFAWRRDVRRFLSDPVDCAVIDGLISTATLAPSVGNSQPWRFVTIDAPERRAAVRANFEAANAEALGDYGGEQARLYATLKLSGLDQAPVHLAIFADINTRDGHGLGKKTMPETLAYSVVGAVNTLWLAARAEGIGVGWVSILDPVQINSVLDVPEDWLLVAYLCIGYPQEEHIDPELERHGWQDRLPADTITIRR